MDTPSLGKRPDNQIQRINKIYVVVSVTLTITMSTKKDMRRVDLVIPYVEPPAAKSDTDISGAMSTTLPMAAMFTRNRMIGWVAVIISIQNWLSETPDQSKNAATPSYMSVFMSLMSLAVTYMPLFFPTPGARVSTTADAPAPSPSP